MNGANYNERHNHPAFLQKINSCIRENSKTPVVRHHMNKYDGHFPIWVIIEYFSLGTLSYFYRGMKNNDKHLDFPYQWESLLRHKKEAATLIP